MIKKRNLRSKINDYLYDHIALRTGLDWAWAIIVSTVSALFFAIGYKCFLAPNYLSSSHELKLVSGGASGISQTIIAALKLIPGFPEAQNFEDLMYGILYFAVNVPIFILAWFGIGKRFSVITLINVLEVSLFTNLLGNTPDGGLIDSVAQFVDKNGGLFARAVFGGACVGLSTALTFKIDASSGGVDVIAYYVALKKSTLCGKYSTMINSCTIIIFTLLTATKIGWSNANAYSIIGCVFYAVLYMFVVMFVVDMINLRNKKMEIKVVTENPELVGVLLANIPHGATLIHGSGAFSGKEKTIIEMIVSSYELKNTVKVIQEADPTAFVTVSELTQVYGHFFIKPVK
ncbi:MAG TPA: hypothetical protein DCR94_03475 [Firmicutes bacterium]|nr:hypothetical protein [Bacillota bacterium]